MQRHEPITGWRDGLDPRAGGMVVRSIGRGNHHLGDAFRIELADPGIGSPQLIHVQWIIASRAGPWATWTTCRPEEMAEREAALRAADWIGDEVPGEPLANVED